MSHPPPPKSKEDVASVLLTNEELQEFKSLYSTVLEYFSKLASDMVPETQIHTDWLMKAINYNVQGGKMIRGLMIPATYKKFVENFDPKEMRLAYILGWLGELNQAMCLMADDIMDHSKTRRGKPCWYKVEDVGMVAVNDCFLFENLVYSALRYFVGDNKALFMELNDCIRENAIKTIYGQSLDCLTASGDEDILERYTMERYTAIVKYKTSYYTFYLPVVTGMILAKKSKDKDTLRKLEEILLEVGHYFQIQDDYLDCFGDPYQTGKIGTDIQDNKCTWLFVQAVERCNTSELQILLENYGSDDPQKVERVKNLYHELELPDIFEDFESETYCKIEAMIKTLPNDTESAIRDLVRSIYKRKK